MMKKNIYNLLKDYLATRTKQTTTDYNYLSICCHSDNDANMYLLLIIFTGPSCNINNSNLSKIKGK